MTPDLEERIRSLYREALARPESERARLVAERAAGDDVVRAEVERLLAQAPTEAGTLSPNEPLGPGARLGAYVVESRIGAGGMGEVFRAADTRLDRRVAIKVCATHVGERFEREAKALSALNHPHVCTLFDVGPNYLVMELIEGETLAERIARGPLSLEEAARHGAEIAEALAEAHRAGVVHRDLKPQNVMLTRHGVKVLDFGIAKLVTDDALTRTGAIIGTAAYLAPEQLAGEPATQRSDLYALGVVLHEMVTGRRPPPGAGARATDGNTRPKGREGGTRRAAFDAVVARLLEPDPARRPSSAADVAAQLHRLGAPPVVSSVRRRVAIAAVLVVVAAAAAATWALRTREASAPLEVVRLIPFTSIPGAKSDPAYSPDGTTLAFVWDGASGKAAGIYVLRDGVDSPLRLTSGATDVSPAWSPDGKRIAFLRMRAGQANELMLVTVPEHGLPQQPLTETKVRDVRQPEIVTRTRRPILAWAADGSAVVLPLPDAETGLTSLYRLDLDGAAPQRVIASLGGQGDSGPAMSRDGRWIAYSDTEAQGSQIYVARLGAGGVAVGDRETVPGSAGFASSLQWSPDSERLLWTYGPQLMEWRRGGTAATVYVGADVFQGLTASWRTASVPEVVFANVPLAAEIEALTLVDGGRAVAGPAEPVIKLGGPKLRPSLSPDGRWLVFSAFGKSGLFDLWISGARGENPRQLVPLSTAQTVWSFDSRHIAFHARPAGVAQLYVIDIDASGAATATRQVTESAFSLFGPVWSADGRYLYATGNRTPTAQRVVRVRAEGGELEDLFEGDSQRVSMDGKRIYYGKSLQPGIFVRSLEGDVASNPEQRVLDDYVGPQGFVVSERGIVYVGRDEARNPVALRFFDFELQRSFDLAPPLVVPVPILTVSPDGTRLLFERVSSSGSELTRMELRRRN